MADLGGTYCELSQELLESLYGKHEGKLMSKFDPMGYITIFDINESTNEVIGKKKLDDSEKYVEAFSEDDDISEEKQLSALKHKNRKLVALQWFAYGLLISSLVFAVVCIWRFL